MTIYDLLSTNMNILNVRITFRNADSLLMGHWNLGVDTGYGKCRSFNDIPQWCRRKDVSDEELFNEFFKETNKSINYRTSGHTGWGYNGKLPKKVEQMEVDMWSCSGCYPGRNLDVQGGCELCVTVLTEKRPEPEKKKDAKLPDGIDGQMDIMEFI